MPDPRYSWPIIRGRSHFEYEPRFVEPARTVEDFRASCEELGLVTCSCTRVERTEPEGEAKLIYNPKCVVHNTRLR